MRDVPYSSGRNSFHLMRFVLATMVILCHSHTLVYRLTPLSMLTGGSGSAGGMMNEGTLAVDAFLTISGFLLCQSGVRNRNPLIFLRNRALRILPAFLASLCFTALLIGGLAYEGTYAEYLRQPYDGPFSYITNWLSLNLNGCKWNIRGVFASNAKPGVNVSLWTLKHEVLWYAVMALLILTTLNRRRPVYLVLWGIFLSLRILWTCFGFPVMPDKTSWWLLNQDNWPQFVETGLFFFTGTVLYAYRDRVPRRWYLAVIALLALVLMCVCSFVQDEVRKAGAWQQIGWRIGFIPLQLIYACAVPYLVIYLACSPVASGFARFGDLSFGMYVYSYPMQQLLYHISPNLTPMLHFGLSMACALPVAWLSWRVLEEPFLRLKRPRTAA